jgi:hypothetical protein
MRNRLALVFAVALSFTVTACSADLVTQPTRGAATSTSAASVGTTGTYTIRLFNVDDTVTVYINGQQAARAGYFEDTGYLPIDAFLIPGRNEMRITVDNYIGGWTFGYEIRKNGVLVNEESCGTVGTWGCKGNDQTLGRVLDRRRYFTN